MIPGTLLGLLLFIGAVGPGYVWVRVAEVRKPQQQRAGVLEAAELAFVGLLATGFAALLLLAVADAWKRLGIDLDLLARDGGRYLLVEPVRGIGLVLSILALAFLLAWGAALVVHRGGSSSIRLGYSVWDRLFRVGEPEVSVYAALELRDGRRFGGYVYVWDVGTSEEDRELALHAPITMRDPDGSPVPLDAPFQFISLRRADVVWLAVSQTPSPFDR